MDEIHHALSELKRDNARHEADLQRYEHALTAIQELVWPECTDVQADAPDWLITLVTKVGKLVRSQAWDVERRHVIANRKLAALLLDERAARRRAEQELRELQQKQVVP